MNFLSLIKDNKKIIIAISIIIVFLFLCFSDYGFVKRLSLEAETSELKNEILIQKKITDSLNNVIDKLQYDDLEIERIAREEYGMTKPNEDVYYIKK